MTFGPYGKPRIVRTCKPLLQVAAPVIDVTPRAPKPAPIDADTLARREALGWRVVGAQIINTTFPRGRL